MIPQSEAEVNMEILRGDNAGDAFENANFYDYCGNANSIEANKVCTERILDSRSVETYFATECKGSEACEIDMNKFNLAGIRNEDMERCMKKYSVYYLQYDCRLDEDYKKTGLAIALIGCLSCLYFMYLIYYL